MSEKQVDYLDALMEILITTPQLPSKLRRKVGVLQQARKADKESNEVSIPIKVPKITDKELELFTTIELEEEE